MGHSAAAWSHSRADLAVIAVELVLRGCEWSGEGGESKVFSWFMVAYAVGKYVGWWVGSWRHLVGSQRRCLEPLTERHLVAAMTPSSLSQQSTSMPAAYAGLEVHCEGISQQFWIEVHHKDTEPVRLCWVRSAL